MRANDRGDLGFLESMIALMAVITVLTAYLGMVAGGIAVTVDPTDGLDPDMFTGSVEDEKFVPSFEGYVADYLESRGLSGMMVSVHVPGWPCEDLHYTIGTLDGSLHTRAFSVTVPADGGRELVAMMEVTLCV